MTRERKADPCPGCGGRFKVEAMQHCSECRDDYCEECRRECGHSSEAALEAERTYEAQRDRLNRQKKGPFANGRVF